MDVVNDREQIRLRELARLAASHEQQSYYVLGGSWLDVGGQLLSYVPPTDTPDDPIFGASGPDHSAGDVPDPGGTAGTTRFLREDATWAVPPSSSGSLSFAQISATLSVPSSTITTIPLGSWGGSSNVSVLNTIGTGQLEVQSGTCMIWAQVADQVGFAAGSYELWLSDGSTTYYLIDGQTIAAGGTPTLGFVTGATFLAALVPFYVSLWQNNGSSRTLKVTVNALKIG